jgi:hypothetical protein
MACHGWEKPPTTQSKFLQALNVLPAQFEVWRRSSARRAAMKVLALAKAYYPMMDTLSFTRGWPSRKADGTPFTREDCAAVDKMTRHHATLLTDTLSLSSFQPGYNAEDKKLYPKDPAVVSLDPKYRAPLPVEPETGVPSTETTNMPAPARPVAEDTCFPSVFSICWEEAEGVPKKKKKSSAHAESSSVAPKTPAVPAETGPTV